MRTGREIVKNLFLNLQHRNATKNDLQKKLATNDGDIHYTPTDIVKEEAKKCNHMFSFQSSPSSLNDINCKDFPP